MIEIIYQGEEEMAEQKKDLKLPKNVRQIGDVGQENKKIYVEDYVMSYVKHFSSRNLKYGVLLGNVIKQGGNTYLFISGAVCAKPVLDNEIQFDEDVWTGIYDDIKSFFDHVEIVGWFLSIPGMLAGDMANIQKIHLDNFAGNDKVCFILDRIECEDTFHIYQDGGMKKIEGHYIYYEKNMDMQSYMMVNEESNEVPAEYEQSKKKNINVAVHRLLYGIEKESKKQDGDVSTASEPGKTGKRFGKNYLEIREEGIMKKKNRKSRQNKNERLNEKVSNKMNDKVADQINDKMNDKAADQIDDKMNSKMADKMDEKSNDKINYQMNSKMVDQNNEIRNLNHYEETKEQTSVNREEQKNMNSKVKVSIATESAAELPAVERKDNKERIETKGSDVKLNIRKSNYKNENKVIPEVKNEKGSVEQLAEEKKRQAPLFAYSASSFILIAILLGAISVIHTSGQIKDIKNMVSKMANAGVTQNPENASEGQSVVNDSNNQDQENVHKEGGATVEIVDAAADVTTIGEGDGKKENDTTENNAGAPSKSSENEISGENNKSGDGTEKNDSKQDENNDQNPQKGENEQNSDQQNEKESAAPSGGDEANNENNGNNENKKEEQEASVEPQYYTVKKGDSLYSISKLVYGDISMIDKIREVNHMQESDENITIGQRLLLP